MTQLDNELTADLERPRGQWVKTEDFSKLGQKIGGTLVSLEIVPRINPKNGQVVVGQKSGKPRKLYRVRFELPLVERNGTDDEGIRIWDANEAGQNAIRDAYKAVGTNQLIGGKFEAKVSQEAADEYSQAEYKVRFEKTPNVVELPDDDKW